MKTFLTATALLLTPILSHGTSNAPTRLIEAKAVIASPEIAALLSVEKSAHNLSCETETPSDVVIKPDADMDSFEVVFGCNDANGGANVQRIHFSGGVYTSSPTSTTADVVLTNMLIELSE